MLRASNEHYVINMEWADGTCKHYRTWACVNGRYVYFVRGTALAIWLCVRDFTSMKLMFGTRYSFAYLLSICLWSGLQWPPTPSQHDKISIAVCHAWNFLVAA